MRSKEIKKSSYYVWFLGAQESRGLRGVEFIGPVLDALVAREREIEPFKVTLQVSNKGLKIIQNVPVPLARRAGPTAHLVGHHHPTSSPPSLSPNSSALKDMKAETVKHVIPHHAITCVLQERDLVACILLLYNPVTNCPVHVHGYRCDSVETAEILAGQLHTLTERPENQKKLVEIEARLKAKGLLASSGNNHHLSSGSRQGIVRPPRSALGVQDSVGSDGRSTRESESSGGSSREILSPPGPGLATLYDSLAAELREKLNGGNSAVTKGNRPKVNSGPLLLPPRDYDTVHRQKGNLTAIELRRCQNANIVGAAGVTGSSAQGGSSGGGGQSSAIRKNTSRASSGIGSDPLSENDERFSPEQCSSDDDDWQQEGIEPTWRGASNIGLPRPRGPTTVARSPSPNQYKAKAPPPPVVRQHSNQSAPASVGGASPPGFHSYTSHERHDQDPEKAALAAKDRFKDAKEKFLMLERERAIMARKNNPSRYVDILPNSRPIQTSPGHQQHQRNSRSSEGRKNTNNNAASPSRTRWSQDASGYRGREVSPTRKRYSSREHLESEVIEERHLRHPPPLYRKSQNGAPRYASAERFENIPEDNPRLSRYSERYIPDYGDSSRRHSGRFYEEAASLHSNERVYVDENIHPVLTRTPSANTTDPLLERFIQYSGSAPHPYHELPDRERFPGLDRETARVTLQRRNHPSHHDQRLRHSYAEPNSRMMMHFSAAAPPF